MEDWYERQWFRKHNGLVMGPQAIFDILMLMHRRDIVHAIIGYERLERRGHLIPQAYRDGQVKSVRLYFPPYKGLRSIAQEEGTPLSELETELRKLTRHRREEHEIGLPLKVILALQQYDYVRKHPNQLVGLGRNGTKWVERIRT